MFVLGKPFQPSLVFVGKAGAYPLCPFGGALAPQVDLDQEITKNKKFLEYNFREGLFYF